MMFHGVLLALVIGGADALSPFTLEGLSFKAPLSWQKSAPDEHSVEWSAPGEGAKMAVSVYPLEKPQSAQGCMRKMLDAVGREGFEALTLGGQPAAKKVTSDWIGEGEAAKVDANRVTTTTVLGCNGRVKWLLTWTARTRAAPRFGPMLKRILASVAYGRVP